MSNEYRALMESRKPLINVIELKEWWYVPDASHPTEIRVSVVVHQSGRFAGNVTGEQTDSSGSSTTIFESTNGPESQRQVRSDEAFTYAFPLKILSAGRADDVRITLYLFKAPSGPDRGDITKVFMNSPQRDDDGEYFYGVLPPPSQAENRPSAPLPASKQAPYLKAIAIVRDTRVLPFQDIECFHQARLVRITHGRLAVWLDPLGMLHPQVLVNLLLQIGIRMEVVNHDRGSVYLYLTDAIALANKMIGQVAMNTIIPKATSSDK
jgi:hypothetical protein